MWSGPRNISTALMRAWENRADCVVVDEPLYAHYLARTGIDHPGREDVLAAGETDWRRVVARLCAPLPRNVAVLYQKHMAHHLLPDVGRGWLAQLTNVLLIRDPREVVASYVESRGHVRASDIGLAQQLGLYDDLSAAGDPPAVIDAADFLRDPEGHLRGLCDLVGLDFDEHMLRWPAGPRDSDGVWAPYWYTAVRRSTGFAPYRRRDIELGREAALVEDECRPLYESLRTRRWVL